MEKIKALYAQTNAIYDQVTDLPGGDPRRAEAHGRIDPLVAESWELRIAIAQVQATTIEGFRAKAWVVRTFTNMGEGEYFDPTSDEAVGWSLAGDLLGLPAEKATGGEA